MRELGYDLRIVLRTLFRTRGFTALAVMTLALGVGISSAVFSVYDRVLVRPIPTPGLDRLVAVRATLPELDLVDVELAPAEVLDLADAPSVFSAVAGFRMQERTITGVREPVRVSVTTVLSGFGDVFAIQPHLGRFIRPDESEDGRHLVAVVSYDLWQRLSGGDPQFISSTLELDEIAYEVVGVLPADFRYPHQTHVWIPFRFTEQWRANRGSLMMTTVARLRPDVMRDQLMAVLEVEAARWNMQYHAGSREEKRLSTVNFIDFNAGPVRSVLVVLMGAALFVLVIAAFNVGNLQLVRSAARNRDLGVRVALGASRGRLLRLLVLENLTLALAGAVVGLGLAFLATYALELWAPVQHIYRGGLHLDGRVLAFATLVASLAAVVFGTLPVLRLFSVQPNKVLAEFSRGSSFGVRNRWLLQASAGLQVALALVLVLGSLLMVGTLSNLVAVDPGFRSEGLYTAQIAVTRASYDTPERRVGVFRELVEAVRAQPGVHSAAVIWGLPFTDQTNSGPFDIPGRPAAPGDPERRHEIRYAGDGYFRTLGIPLLSGREFDGTEAAGEPAVVIVDDTFAERFFPGEDAVGRQIMSYEQGLSTIIGVVRQVDHYGIGSSPMPTLYYSTNQDTFGVLRSLVVRSDLSAPVLTGMMRAALGRIDPGIPLYDARMMEDRIADWLGPRRLALLALGAFAVASMVLAALGIYAIIRHATEQRTREIGIRIALGARPLGVMSMVWRQGALISGAGVFAGAIGALWLTQLLEAILYNIPPHDPRAFVLSAAIIAGISLLATTLPAFRATRIDPASVLRDGP